MLTKRRPFYMSVTLWENHFGIFNIFFLKNISEFMNFFLCVWFVFFSQFLNLKFGWNSWIFSNFFFSWKKLRNRSVIILWENSGFFFFQYFLGYFSFWKNILFSGFESTGEDIHFIQTKFPVHLYAGLNFLDTDRKAIKKNFDSSSSVF